MKHGLMHAFGFVATALLALVAGPAGAATTASGPYYANPSWDQQLPASTRFVVLSNWIDADHPSGGAAVLDRETGLVWEQSPSRSTFIFELALVRCNFLSTGGRLGWRLPSVQELASLVDPSVSAGPTLPSGHPFSNVQFAAAYWSASAALGTSVAWAVDFSDGSLINGLGKSSVAINAWCVRGGQGVEPQ